MSKTTDESRGRASQFTPFEWGTIILLAGLANASTFLEELLARTLNAPAVTGVIPDRPINYLLWGLAVALALRIARRDGTATLYMTITGMIFAVIQPAGIAWAFGFVLAGVVIDTYLSGRRALALAEVAILTLVASLVNRSPGLQQLLNSVTLDLSALLGIKVPFFALMLIVILASLFGRLHFQFLGRPTEEYAASLSDTMVGVTLQPFIVVLVTPSILSRTPLEATREAPMAFLAVVGSILLSSLLGGILGFGLAGRVRRRLGLD